MTCCSGSSVSSAEETMKVASFSSSLIEGSFLTSFSNCSSGTSARSFLPSGPTTAAWAWICSAVLTEVVFFAVAFLAGAFFAGAFFAAALLAVELAELEDTNYLSVVLSKPSGNFGGATRPVPVNSRALIVSRRPSCSRHASGPADDEPSRGRGGLRGGLLLLLVGPDLLQRGRIHHVGHRTMTLEAVVPHGRLPALRSYVELLGQQGHEDLRLLLAETGERGHPPDQVLAVGRLGPDALSVPVVLLDHDPGHRLDPLGHRAREPVHGRRLGAQRGELLGVRGGDLGRFQPSEPVDDLRGTPERVLHRVLLVEQHAQQQGERRVGEHLVGTFVAGDVDGHRPIMPTAPVIATTGRSGGLWMSSRRDD